VRGTGDIESRGADAFHRGRTYEAEGDLKTARRWYREAAEAGHRAAAVTLGGLLASEVVASVDELDDVWRGTSWALDPAEEWWQRGIHGLNARSARELGRLLDWDPELVETEHRLRVAYETGDAMAGYRLARLIEERGSLLDRGYSAEGEGWLNEADTLMDSVSAQTRPAAMALYRKLHGRWFPGWRLRRFLSSGQVPIGIDAHAVRTHCWTLVHCQRRHSTGRWPLQEAQLRQRLEREHEGGDIEATFLLGVLERESDRREAHGADRWLRSAAEAGHRQAAFEVGTIRAYSGDGQGAVYWFRRAAEAGHPGAAFELALELCTTDRAAAETECRKAARAGQLHAAALLRILQRGPAAAEPVDDGSGNGRIAELLTAWDELSGLAPEPDRCVDYLAKRSGLPRADVARVRRVRNQCAHPAKHGWPASYEIDIALTTARALRRQMAMPHDSEPQPDAG
jgi:TPR repeat protein